MGRALHLMVDTANYAPPVSLGDYSDLSYGAATNFRCRWNRVTGNLDRGEAGRGLDYSDTFLTETAVPERARVWPPGVATTAENSRLVLKVEQMSAPQDGYTLYRGYT